MSTEALSLEFALPEEVKMKAAQQRAIRKLNWALLPLLCLMVATCYIDRSNLAFASLQLKQDPPFEFTDTTYGLGSGIFFIGYAMFQVPSNVVLSRVGAPVWLGIIVSLWGLAACMLAGMNSLAAFLILRFLLGVAEAGTFPGMWYHLSLFYPNRHLTVPISATNVAIAVAQIIASPLAAVLLSMDGVAGLRGWQWLFLLEGMPTVLLGMAIFLFLPRTPYDIKGMTASEREFITSGVEAGAKTGKPLLGGVGEMWRDIKAAASHRRLWYMAVAFALKSATSKGLMFWTPLAIEAITGLDSSQSGNTKVVLLASIPYLASTLFQIWQAWSSQRMQERRLHTGLPFVVGGLLMAMVPLLWQAAPSGVFLVLVVAQGVVHAVGPWTAMVSGLFSAESQAAGLAIWNSVGNIGGFFGSALYGMVKDRLGSDAAGMLLLGCTLLAAGAMVLAAKDPGAAPPQYQRLPAHADDVPPTGSKAAHT